MNLILLDDDSDPHIINVDNVVQFHYDKDNKEIHLYTISGIDIHYQDDDAEKIYNYLKGLATKL